MLSQITLKFFFFVVILSVSCSTGVSTTDTGMVSPEPTPNSMVVLTPTLPTSTVEATLTATRQPATLINTPTIAPVLVSPTATTPISEVTSDCPVLVNEDSQTLWMKGSILFSTGQVVEDSFLALRDYPEQPGIWSISAGGLTPKLVYESLEGSLISPDGAVLLDFKRNVQDSTQEAIFYSIRENKEIRLLLPLTDELRPFEWLPDGRFRYTAEIERIEEDGEKRTVITIDPVSQQYEISVEEISLPGYYFDSSEIAKGIASGYDSVDPTGQFVLYTAHAPDRGVNVLLRNLQTNEIIWQSSSNSLPGFYQPVWDTAGNQVLFGIYVSGTDGGHEKIVSLSNDGEVEQLPPQPYPFLDEDIIRSLSRSPDGRYILYTLTDSPSVGAGFIVDTLTAKIGEICEAGTQFMDGVWLSDSQFAYRVLIEKDGQWTHSLRVIDIPTWTTQVVFEPSPGYGVNIFGWTPIEFP